MGIADRNAFEGAHDHPQEGRFFVKHFGYHLLRDLNKYRRTPRGHHAMKRVGYYWSTPGECTPFQATHGGAPLHGPFSSSRRCYKDAMITLDKRAEEEARSSRRLGGAA